MTNLHIFSNKVVVKKNSKNYQIYSKLYQKSSMKYLLRDQIELLKNEKNNLRSLYINNKKTTFIACNFFFDKRASFNKIKNKQFIMLSPTIFVNYITDQLKKKGYAKQATFKTNLKAAILTFSYKILKHIQNNIAGFKIVCSGK